MNLETRNNYLINFVVFITSFSILCYEVIFTRVFAYSQWQNLSSVIITVALLGFGISGTTAVVYREQIEKKYPLFIFGSSFLFPLFLAAGFYTSAFLRFNPYEMAIDLEQIFKLSLYFFLMGIPFFAGATVICLALLKQSISSAYFFNLLGSGAGAFTAMIALFLLHPYDIMTVIILISFIPVFLLSSINGKKYITASIIAASITASAAFYFYSLVEFKNVSQYKSISGALNLPGSKILYTGFSPLSVIQVVEAEGLRSTAGLSLASVYQVPVQKGIFFDGDSMSPITPFDGDVNKIRHLEFIASYLPYYLRENNSSRKILIIGSGGGESILKSILSGFGKIDAVEVNSDIISLMKKEFASFSGNIYNRSNLELFNVDGRSYIKQTSEKYDLIEISLLDAYNTSASGVYALNETYLYTTESFSDYYSLLTDDGILSVTRWITTPPRDSFKIFNTAIESLSKLNLEKKENHFAAIRSLQTMTLLISKSEFTQSQISGLRKFCSDRYFDIIYYPGVGRNETNRYIKLTEPVYYDAFMKLLSEKNNEFIEAYDFDITTASDNRPYFYNFFKPRLLEYIKKYGPSQVPVTEWGYLILLIMLIPVIFISFISILLPVVKGSDKADKLDLILFFSLIAAGYFFIEMPLIQKMVLFLGHPSYSISVIFSGLMIFSGLGSYYSDRLFPEKFRIMISVLLIALIIFLYQVTLDRVLIEMASFHISIKITVVLLLIAPPAFFMGFPFPHGLAQMKKRSTNSLPLAWGVNGFFSVISIITAALIAIISGFNVVFITAVICYITAGIISLGFYRNGTIK